MRQLESARGVWREEESCHNISDEAFTEEVAFKLGFADPLSLKFSFRSMKFSSFLKVAQKETETERASSEHGK